MIVPEHDKTGFISYVAEGIDEALFRKEMGLPLYMQDVDIMKLAEVYKVRVNRYRLLQGKPLL
jgi:hypothetical protein